MDVDGNSFLDQFLIPYVIEVQKIPTIHLINFVRVDQSLQLDVNYGTILKKPFNETQKREKGEKILAPKYLATKNLQP